MLDISSKKKDEQRAVIEWHMTHYYQQTFKVDFFFFSYVFDVKVQITSVQKITLHECTKSSTFDLWKKSEKYFLPIVNFKRLPHWTHT